MPSISIVKYATELNYSSLKAGWRDGSTKRPIQHEGKRSHERYAMEWGGFWSLERKALALLAYGAQAMPKQCTAIH